MKPQTLKPFMITAIFVLLVMQTEAQAEFPSNSKKKETKFEAGVNLYERRSSYSGTFLSGTFAYGPKFITNHLINGVYLKYYKGKNGIRASFNYFQKKVSYEYEPDFYSYHSTFWWSDYPGATHNAGSSRTWELRAGYQRHLLHSQILQPYILGDLRYAYALHWGRQNGQVYDKPLCFPPTAPREYLLEQNFIGMQAGLGLRLNANSWLSFTLETAVEYFLLYSKDLKDTKYRRKSRMPVFHPIRVSAGIRF
jgi:hypothetical protein